MPKSDTNRLRHMLDAAREAGELARKRSRESLDTDRLFSLASVHLLEIVGEAAGRVSADTRCRYPRIPWQEIVGMRHRLAHGYDDVDLDIVWQVLTHDLPPLIAELERILAEDP